MYHLIQIVSRNLKVFVRYTKSNSEERAGKGEKQILFVVKNWSGTSCQ